MHDRLLPHSSNTSSVATAEMFHFYRGTAIFRERLRSREATSSERDALWIASSLIGIQYIGHFDATIPTEAWPLKSTEPGEPDWLALSTGKRDIEDFCSPWRTDCCFHKILGSDPLASDVGPIKSYELNGDGFRNLPAELLQFLRLVDPSTWSSSPYSRAADIVSRLMPEEYNQANFIKFLAFTHFMEPAFRQLWRSKDPGALLLVLYWYSKAAIPSEHWWVR